MSSEVEVRYLLIEWQSEGVARRIEVAPNPLEVEPSAQGRYVVETAIFNGFYPWLGIRGGSDLGGEIAPVFVSASGQEVPMMHISDAGGGGGWWVQNSGWDPLIKRHLCELQRAAGVYNVRIGDVWLKIDNRLSGFSRADIQAYIDDFRGDLIWLIMNDAGAATATGNGIGAANELLDALSQLQSACQSVLESPAVSIREEVAPQPVAKLRPCAATFSGYARNPAARSLLGRVFKESPNTPENRYLRHMVETCHKFSRAYVVEASRQTGFLERLASREHERAKQNREMKVRTVEAEVFDSQSKAIEGKLEALANCRSGGDGHDGRLGSFPIRIQGRYGQKFAFFYEPQVRPVNEAEPPAYRVLSLPPEIFRMVLGVSSFCKNFTLKGRVTSGINKNSKGKVFRELKFLSVHEVLPETDVLEKRRRRRLLLEENGWISQISSGELIELDREAMTSDRLAEHALKKQSEITASLDDIGRINRQLEALIHTFEAKGIDEDFVFPMGMRFVSNPNYASCLSAFNKVRDFLGKSGFDYSNLEKINRIGILHASDVYEKWCLLKICNLLMKDFRFSPTPGWEEKLISTSLARSNDVKFEFIRDDIGMKVILTSQVTMSSGRRPDFTLEVFAKSADREEGCGIDNEYVSRGGLVLDAKFRGGWKFGGLRQTLDELIDVKGYASALSDGGVFILQPCEFTARPSTSPLDWGPHCNYGGQISHKSGWIQLGVSEAGEVETQHLKRLLAMLLQRAFLDPEIKKRSDSSGGMVVVPYSFCIICGERHKSGGISLTASNHGDVRWTARCGECGAWAQKTHCYACRWPLFKNGTIWTYHTTIADQVTNVACPACGNFFD